MTRRGVETTIAILFAVVILVVGGIAVAVFVTISPVHTDSAAVPSTASSIQPGVFASAVDESRRLARALVVNENLAGLSVAVAHDGELVWAEGFGFADVDRRTSVTPVTRFRTAPCRKR
jgi:CubicO group peptidase (beta-lactamase class C family)